MNAHYRYVIPTITAIVLAASTALAQMPPQGRGMPRTPPTAEQIAARQAQFCADRQARQAARFTYVEERLKLTSAQKPLFERWKAAAESQDATRQADCTKPRTRPTARPTLPQRNAQREAMLKAQLESLQKIRGPQEALYNALSDEQKPLFEHAGGFGHRGDGRGFGGRSFGGHGHGFGGRGFGPMRGAGMRGPGRGGPGMTPPAPPPGND